MLVLSACTRVSAVGNYPTYVFTHSEIVLFGYVDGTSLTVERADGGSVWQGRLNAGQHHVVRSGSGVYRITGSQPYATLVGDPTTGAVLGFYAVDQLGRGVSKLLHTYQSSGSPGLFGIGEGPRNFVIFGYYDNTSVTLKETDRGRVIWRGTLNRGQAHFEPDLKHVFLTIEASQPVSALSYSDQGYYVPAESGRFVGRLFYTWAGNAGGWTHDLNVISYTDDTSVVVRQLDRGDIRWQGKLAAGQVQTVSGVNDLLLSIEADKDVAVSIAPTVSYGSDYYHMLFAQDETGAGIGKRFFYPAIAGARLEVFAYEDGAHIEVRDGAGQVAYAGTLSRGESTSFASAHTVYSITSDRPVAALMDWGTQAGADFAPPYYAAPTATLPAVAPPPWWPLPLLAAAALGLGALVYGLLRARSHQRVSGPTFRPTRPRPGPPVWPVDRPRPPTTGSDVTHGRKGPQDRSRP